MASPSDHQATVIDGKAIAQTIRSEIASEVTTLSQKYSKVCILTCFVSLLIITITYFLISLFILITLILFVNFTVDKIYVLCFLICSVKRF